MDSQKWEKAKSLYESALKIGRGDRSQFLTENCSGDDELLREVESLLAFTDESGDFLEKPAIGEVADAFLADRSLAGKKIDHYDVIELIGSGGMGEVYLAEDTRMKRKIALKILPVSMSENSTFASRFEREALAASALNHPNILTVFEFGQTDGMRFIACEFVKGETLRDRLDRGDELGLAWKLDCALQVAAALRAAHESNIIHRDIKPENIMVRSDGIVKVLDFGLAKLVFSEDEPVSADDETIMRTTPGLVMGTVAYMSPEQARGTKTDARTDIWSLGVVLYEMITGKLPYGGDTPSDRIASILTSDPAFSESIPLELNRILKMALQKDAADRYQNTGDLISDLEAFRTEQISMTFNPGARSIMTKVTAPSLPAADTISISSRWRRLLRKWPALIVLLIILGGAYGAYKYYPARQQPHSLIGPLSDLRRKRIMEWNAEPGEGTPGARFSPNGTMIAYSLMKDGQRNIWTKQIPDGKANQITDGKWDYFDPIWSNNGERIAFVSNRDSQTGIWAMPFSGGVSSLLKTIDDSQVRLISWSKDGERIYFNSANPNGGLNVYVLDVSSKQVTKVTNFDPSNSAQFFSVSPGEDRIAYSSGPNEQRRIFVIPIGGGEPVQITDDKNSSDESPVWMNDNLLVYSAKRGGVYQTSIVNVDLKETAQLNLDMSDTLVSDVSRDGSRILLQKSKEESDLWKIDTTDKKEEQLTADISLEVWPDVSQDGRHIVFQAPSESKHLLEGPVLIRPVDDPQKTTVSNTGFSPAFSPDGRRIAFLRDADGRVSLWIANRDGSDARGLTNDSVWFTGFTLMPFNRVEARDFSWSPDSGSIVYSARIEGQWNIWQCAVDGGEPRQISNNTDKNIRLSSPLFMNDGKQVAWMSSAIKPSADETRVSGVYVWNGEASSLVYSSVETIRLIGQNGNDLLIAATGAKQTAKLLKIELRRILPGNKTKALATIDAAYFNNIRISPDGRRVAIAEAGDGKDNIRLISIPSGASTRITSNNDVHTYLSGIAWSPDGKTIYFGKQKKTGEISMMEKANN